MKKLMAVLTIILLLACAGVASAQGNAYGTAYIDGGSSDRVHLRASASMQSASQGLFFTGTEVLCASALNQEWVAVTIGAQSGYIKGEYLRQSAVGAKQPSATVTGIAANSWVNLRQQPDRKAAVAGKLRRGDTALVLGETASHWDYVQVGDQRGYVLADYLALNESAAPGATANPVASKDALAAYRAVLLNEAAFAPGEGMQSRSLSQVIGNFTDGSMQLSHIALLDLDRDGVLEVVIREMVAGYEYGSVILDYQAGQVYGYELGVRGFGELKADGSFSYSSGAADGGFGVLTLNQGAYTVNPLANSKPTGNGASYFINGKATTESGYHTALAQQAQKQSAAWQSFTGASIEALLAR